MVRYVSQYGVLVQTICASDSYQNATEQERKEIDEFLDRKDIRAYFESRVVPQLTFHESLVLEFMNSGALQERTPEEQQKVMGYLTSERFKGVVENLEGRLGRLVYA